MKVSKYVEDRIRTMYNNPHSTQGYPKTAQGNPCVLNDPSITPAYPIIYGNSVQDGTPTSENPVEIQSVGKKSINLINNFSAVPHEEAPNSLDGVVITDEYINVMRDSLFNLVNIPISLKANVAYTLWYELTVYDRPDDATGNSTVAVGVFEEGGLPNRTVDFTKNATIYRVDNYTFAEDTETYVKLWCNYGGVKAKVRAKIMLVEGTYSTDTMPAYEPYSGDKYLVPVTVKAGKETQTVNLYLDEPLRKIGNVADLLDWERGVVIRNIYSVTLPKTAMDAETDVRYGYGWQYQLKNIRPLKFDAGTSYVAKNSVALNTGKDTYVINYNITDNFHLYLTLNNPYGVVVTAMAPKGYASFGEWSKENLADDVIIDFQKEPTLEAVTLPKLPVKPHYTNVVSVDAAVKGELDVNYHSFIKEK